MRRRAPGSHETPLAAAAIDMLLHDLSQPLGAAGLAIDTATLLLDRNDMVGCRERLDVVSTRVARCNLMLRAMKLARGAGPSPWVSPFDLHDVIGAVWTDLKLEPGPVMVGDRAFLEAAFTGLSLIFSPDASRTASLEYQGEIRLIGATRQPALMGFWLSAIRRAGIKVTLRRRGAFVTMTVTPPARRPTMDAEASVRDPDPHAETLRPKRQ